MHRTELIITNKFKSRQIKIKPSSDGGISMRSVKSQGGFYIPGTVFLPGEARELAYFILANVADEEQP